MNNVAFCRRECGLSCCDNWPHGAYQFEATCRKSMVLDTWRNLLTFLERRVTAWAFVVIDSLDSDSLWLWFFLLTRNLCLNDEWSCHLLLWSGVFVAAEVKWSHSNIWRVFRIWFCTNKTTLARKWQGAYMYNVLLMWKENIKKS